MTISENITLADKTTFRIGGEARFFCVATSVDDVIEAVEFAREKSLPIFVLGGGSNVLVADEGFPGLVIKIEITGIEENDRGEEVELIIGAGVDWDECVAFAVSKKLSGLENLSLIPGTVGAAPVQNIGAYGAEVKDTISWVEAVDSTTGDVETISNDECQFSYRDSMFKTSGKKYIITKVAFRLKKNTALNTEYKDIKNYITQHGISEEQLSIELIRGIVIEIRKNKLPDVSVVGTAGSFFKNPIISKANYSDLLLQYPDMPHYAVDDDRVKIPAGWILDTVCGYKGYRDGEVGVYKNQALVLVNFGNATAQEIKNLSEKMIRDVKEKTKINLETEVQFIF